VKHYTLKTAGPRRQFAKLKKGVLAPAREPSSCLPARKHAGSGKCGEILLTMPFQTQYTTMLGTGVVDWWANDRSSPPPNNVPRELKVP